MKFYNEHSQSSVPRAVKAKREPQTAGKRREGGRVVCSSPYKLPWRESALSRTNGYSIAEILLVFGIIAGVLIGVWAMYTMLSEEADVKAAVAEIQIIREAAVQFKTHDGNGTYNNMTLATFGSYLGDGVDQDSDYNPYGVVLNNTFGDYVFLFSDSFSPANGGGGDIYMTSHGLPNMNICRQILEHFGEVQAIDSIGEGGVSSTNYHIPVGKSIFGYVSSTGAGSGCAHDSYSGRVILTLYID